MKQINLNDDLRKIREYVLDRITNFNINSNVSPKPDSDLIHDIEIGYEFEQTGWVALVFDTRIGATCDGHWADVIDSNAMPFAHWADAFWNSDEEPFELLAPGGLCIISDDLECEQFSQVLGESLRDLLLELRENGSLASLPLSPDCTFGIEDFNGYFGWPDGDSRKTEGKIFNS